MSAVISPVTIGFCPMAEESLQDVLMIEQCSCEFPWTQSIFEDCLRARYCCWLLEYDNEIAGYGIMSILTCKAHILNLCIKGDLQNNGLGKEMLGYLIDLARERYANTIFLEVRPSNKPALSIYTKSGFSVVGSRRDYYPARIGREDALIFAKQL